MNKEIIIQTADSMKGSWFLYGNQQHYIKNYSMNEDAEKFTLTTDKKTFTRPYENVMEFLGLFEPVPEREPQLAVSNSKGLFLPEVTVNGAVVKELKDVLMDNIKKVQENKDYIPQAEAIKSNVDSVIQLAKAEIEYLNVLDRLNR
jgi:hypothetical protein